MPGAVIAFTRPAASVSSNTRKPDAGVPSAASSAGARSTSSIANRRSGLSEPKRSMASSYSKTGERDLPDRSVRDRGPGHLDHHPLDEVHHGRLVDEAHLEVELGELRLAVAAQVLVAEAAGDLEVAVDAADHQQLLELLRALRQGVDGAGLEPRRDDEVARALGRALDQVRGLDLDEAVGVVDLADGLDQAAAQEQAALHRLAADVEVAVARRRLSSIVASGSLM